MISYLIGQPLLHGTQLTILVNGVGYGVATTSTALARLSNQAQVELFIYTHVKEEALELFGFESLNERELFMLLLSVSGVGPRTALGIMNLGSQSIVDAVQQANVTTFASVPRVGKKLAQKIIIELKSKLGSLQELNLGPRSSQEQDVFDALLALGFDEHQVGQVISQLEITESSETGILVKQAIKLLSK